MSGTEKTGLRSDSFILEVLMQHDLLEELLVDCSTEQDYIGTTAMNYIIHSIQAKANQF